MSEIFAMNPIRQFDHIAIAESIVDQNVKQDRAQEEISKPAGKLSRVLVDGVFKES